MSIWPEETKKRNSYWLMFLRCITDKARTLYCHCESPSLLADEYRKRMMTVKKKASILI